MSAMDTATSSDDSRQDAAMTSRKGAHVSNATAEKRSTCGDWMGLDGMGLDGIGLGYPQQQIEQQPLPTLKPSNPQTLNPQTLNPQPSTLNPTTRNNTSGSCLCPPQRPALTTLPGALVDEERRRGEGVGEAGGLWRGKGGGECGGGEMKREREGEGRSGGGQGRALGIERNRE